MKATPHECADRWCRCTQYEAVAGGRDCTCTHPVNGHRHYTDRRVVVGSIDEATPRITARKEFRLKTGSMRGVVGGAAEMGHLPDLFHDEAREADYVVYSYQTPIAWVTARGQRVIPDVGYSPTTGSHQYTVKFAWQGTDWVGSTFPVRGRMLRPAGGGRRGGGMDDPYPAQPSNQNGQWPAGILERRPVTRTASSQEFRNGTLVRDESDDWRGSADSFRHDASVESPDLDTPWFLRGPARGASYPPMGERQG